MSEIHKSLPGWSYTSDAFFELESEGLITFSTGRGRFVVNLNFNDLQEIYSLRTTLEELAIELACERADQGDFDRLKVIIIQMEKMRDS